jgi:hypothetical protein
MGVNGGDEEEDVRKDRRKEERLRSCEQKFHGAVADGEEA